MAIGRKQKSVNSDWIDAYRNIKQIITEREVTTQTDATLREISAVVGDKKAAYAWSSGKDSIVLSHVLGRYGVDDCMLTISNLEYPATMEWINNNGPKGLSIINTGQDLEWLTEHPEMLFPNNFTLTHRWGKITHHKGQRIYYASRNLDMMLLGRRRQDGNYVGNGANIYTTTKNLTYYSPLSEWSHEMTLAYLVYNGLELPPVYWLINGFLVGSGTWPHRRTDSKAEGWRQTYSVDPSIVESAAPYFPDAEAIVAANR